MAKYIKSKLFGKNVEPACCYCELGSLAHDKKMILCIKRGITSPYYHCRKFIYAPLKRIPKQKPKMREYSFEEFKL